MMNIETLSFVNIFTNSIYEIEIIKKLKNIKQRGEEIAPLDK